MLKKVIAGLTAIALIGACASAEVFSGVTAARSTEIQTLTCSSKKQTLEVNVESGMRVNEGDILASVKPEKVFATQDGTIARVLKDADDIVDGNVLELAPLSRYLVHATVSEGKESDENRMVHCGETVYMKCEKNGTHLAVGRIYSIDGETFMVETTGGELYVGEVVDLYRGSDMKSSGCIGAGTVVENETEKYTASGKIAEIFIDEGDYVERGQLLYSVLPKEGSEITSTSTGIVYAVQESSAQASETSTQMSASSAQTNETSTQMPASSAQTSETSTQMTALSIQAGSTSLQQGDSAVQSASVAAQTESTATQSGETAGVSVTVVPDDQICVQISVDEEIAGMLKIGTRAELVYKADVDETIFMGTVREIAGTAENDSYEVWIKPDEIPTRIGMSVEVWIDCMDDQAA